MADTPNPYAVTTEEMSPHSAVTSGRQGVDRWFQVVVLCVQTSLGLGTLVAAVEIETIIVSGPVLLGIGLVLVFLTRSDRLSEFRFMAWGCVGFPIFCVVLINLMEWGPSQAQTPVSLLCVAFALAMSLKCLLVLVRSRNRARSQQWIGFSDLVPVESAE